MKLRTNDMELKFRLADSKVHWQVNNDYEDENKELWLHLQRTLVVSMRQDLDQRHMQMILEDVEDWECSENEHISYAKHERQ